MVERTALEHRSVVVHNGPRVEKGGRALSNEKEEKVNEDTNEQKRAQALFYFSYNDDVLYVRAAYESQPPYICTGNVIKTCLWKTAEYIIFRNRMR